MNMKQEDRIRYAKRALDGIALGDCFGQTFFVPEEIACQRIQDREILKSPWHFTDDTVMAIRAVWRDKSGRTGKGICCKLRIRLASGIWRYSTYDFAQYRRRKRLAEGCIRSV